MDCWSGPAGPAASWSTMTRRFSCAPASAASSNSDEMSFSFIILSRTSRVVSQRDGDDGRAIEGKHERQIRPGRAVGAGEFLPHQNAPERGNHRRRLADGVRDRHADKAGRDEVEVSAQAPDDAAENAEHVVASAGASKSGERNRLADERTLHEIDIYEEAADECAQGEQHGDAIGGERGS